MAARVLQEDAARPVFHAVQLAFARPATDAEQRKLGAFLDAQKVRYGSTPDSGRRALADLCHMLLSANEFAYVD